MHRLMLVDDEVAISMQLKERLTSMGYEIVGMVSSGEEAVALAKDLRPDLVLMDIVMPGKIDGIAAAEIIKEDQDIPVIFLTGYAENHFIERAKKAEPFGYIVKPFQESEIRALIEVALHKKQMERYSEERYRTLFENTSDAIFVFDMQTHIILDANRQAEQLVGRPREEIIGMHQSGLYPPEHAEYFRDKFHRNVQKDQIFDLEAEVIRKDGRIVPVFISAGVISRHGKEVIQGLFRDIREEKRLLDLTQEITARRLIEKAKGILTDRHNISEKEAMRQLQKESRRQRKKIKEIAQAVISSDLILN